jgi:quinol monooxygenase YgiN
MTVVLAVRWVALDGEEERVAELLRQLAPASRSEPGCLQYDVYRHVDDARTFFLFERYVDQAALAAHAESAHFKELVPGKALPLLESRERTMLASLV